MPCFNHKQHGIDNRLTNQLSAFIDKLGQLTFEPIRFINNLSWVTWVTEMVTQAIKAASAHSLRTLLELAIPATWGKPLGNTLTPGRTEAGESPGYPWSTRASGIRSYRGELFIVNTGTVNY